MTNQKGRVTKWCRRVAETALRVAAAPARRLFALAIVWGLGGLLVALVLSRPFPVGWATMLIGFGGAVLALAEAMRRATARVLLLDGQGLREEGGRKIVAWSELAGIERGVLAFKPSGGLTLVLHAPAPPAWAPGMWWRLGRRVGVGGVLQRHALRALGDAMLAEMALRQDRTRPR